MEQKERQGSASAKNVENYRKTEFGIFECEPYEFRQHVDELDRIFSDPPRELPFTDYDFGPSVAIQGESVEWKRPGEVRAHPVLFSEGTTRYDIGQGSAGTCWFLSIIAMLAERKELFHRVVPLDAWDQEGGFFRCYFYRFGEWEEVYIDDVLPTVHGDQFWGAKSLDENEIWPALLEKAFARFHGNYNAVYGGQSGDAFLALTGGCSEYIDFDEALEADAASSAAVKARAVHERLKNACLHGECMLTTEVPQKHDKQRGLVGGHAYSLTDARTAKNNSGQDVNLVRIRNPWGNTEWTGPWSDGSREWGTVPEGAVPVANIDDGEFWMSLKDFIVYFSGITVCSLIPDFDLDGRPDSLNFCTTLFGDWFGETAAGFENRIGNPRYLFHVSDEGMDSDGHVPIVLQIAQKLKHRKKNKASIRVDLYKVLGETHDGKPQAVMELLGDVTNVYKMEKQMSVRHKIEPGYYAIVPSTIDAGKEKEFIVRVYTPSPLREIRELGREYAMMESKQFEVPNGVDHKITFTETIFGSWRTGYNAGGQVSNRDTFASNPQVVFTVPNRGGQKMLVDLTLMQEHGGEQLAIGMRVFPIETGYILSEDESHLEYLYSKYENCMTSMNGEDGVFVMGSSAEMTFLLPPGRYNALLHTDGAGEEKAFSLVVRASCHIDLEPFHVQ